MTDSWSARRRTSSESILDLGLPAHVLALIDDTWHPAWLISRRHHADGWMGLIQYTDANGHEQTRRIPTSRLGPGTNP